MTINKKKYYFKTSSSIIGLIVVELLFWITTFSIYQYLTLNVTEFRFEHPNILWMLLIIVLLNILWVRNKIWKKKSKKETFFLTIYQLKNTSDCIKIDPRGPGRNLKKSQKK